MILHFKIKTVYAKIRGGLFFFFLLGLQFSNAQSTGVSVQSLFYKPGFEGGNRNSSFSHIRSIMPGIRGEINFFPKGFHGIGVDYFFPTRDSSVLDVYSAATGPIFKRCLLERSTLDILARFGYKIPQSMNEFLTLHLGFGAGYTQVTEKIITPFPNMEYVKQSRAPGFSLELLAGAIYEFQYVDVFAQFSYMYTISELASQIHRNGFVFGVYVPLKRDD